MFVYMCQRSRAYLIRIIRVVYKINNSHDVIASNSGYVGAVVVVAFRISLTCN